MGCFCKSKKTTTKNKYPFYAQFRPLCRPSKNLKLFFRRGIGYVLRIMKVWSNSIGTGSDLDLMKYVNTDRKKQFLYVNFDLWRSQKSRQVTLTSWTCRHMYHQQYETLSSSLLHRKGSQQPKIGGLSGKKSLKNLVSGPVRTDGRTHDHYI